MISFDYPISAWSVTVTVGVDADTYSDSSGVNAFDRMSTFLSWLASLGRPWAGVDFILWWVVDQNTGEVRWTLTADQPFTLTSVSANDLGWTNEPTPATTHTAANPAPGVWGGMTQDGRGTFNVRNEYPFLDTPGDASGVGAVRPGVPGNAGAKLVLEAVATARAAAALDLLLRTTSGDRRVTWSNTPGDLYNYTARRTRIGQVTRTSVGKNLYRLAFDARI